VNLERVFELFPPPCGAAKSKSRTLSGGEQQMLAIGRCLMSNPIFIMFDEPSLGLSPLMVELVFNAILELKKSGMTIPADRAERRRVACTCGFRHGAGERKSRIGRHSG
jgi:ABC-type branched-subunit amino acid transport system ATPase component